MSIDVTGLHGPRGLDPGGTAGLEAQPAAVETDPAPRPVRRTFTAAYRAQVVAEYEAAAHGQKSAVLRREGLYQSQVRDWMLGRDGLTRQALAPGRAHRVTGGAGGKSEAARLRAEVTRLTRELAASQAVVEIMGKLHGLLETLSESKAASALSMRR